MAREPIRPQENLRNYPLHDLYELYVLLSSALLSSIYYAMTSMPLHRCAISYARYMRLVTRAFATEMSDIP